jgi:D-alanyl-D-alanine carboxypeptidase (penicillin-binding protein 5/6)
VFFAVFLLLVAMMPWITYAEETAEEPSGGPAVTVSSPCVLLMEASTGQVIFEQAADEQRTPASVTKLMTLLLIYEQIESGNLSLEDTVTVSSNAQSMGGSQVFLEAGETQTVETMIKSIVIASGNDASMAMAEHIGGSEENFVAMMNTRAAELGMEHTHFVDCCGLTDDPQHYMTARDIATLSREIVTRFPQIYDYSTIWMEDITHNTRRGSSQFTLTNTNKMLRSYDGCVGLKTGSTSRAGFCVSEVAVRNDITMIAVILGAETSKGRFADAAALLNYGFGVTHLYTDTNTYELTCPKILNARVQGIACRPAEVFHWLDLENRDFSQIASEVIYTEGLSAPIEADAVVGSIRYTYDGQEIGSVDILVNEAVEERTYGDCLEDFAGQLLFKSEKIIP